MLKPKIKNTPTGNSSTKLKIKKIDNEMWIKQNENLKS